MDGHSSTTTIGLVRFDTEHEETEKEETDQDQLGMFSKRVFMIVNMLVIIFTERLQASWHSPIYAFFTTSAIRIGYDNGRKYHYFPCAARKCRNPSGGVRRYLDSKDKAATSNLKSHAIRCFGQSAVDAGFQFQTDNTRDGSIFTAFARQGQHPVQLSHRTHTDPEIR